MVLTDAPFAQREHQLLTRLEIGLAAEGTSILHAVPARCPADAVAAFSSTVVKYEDAAMPFWRSTRSRQLIAAARDALDTNDLTIDVVHVFGRGAWGLGQALARETGAALVLEVWRADLISDALLWARRAGRAAGSGGDGGAIGLLTSSARLAEELRAPLGELGGRSVVVGHAPWGVPASESVRPPIDPTGGIALSVVAEARTSADVAELKHFLEGVALAARRVENLLVFLDSTATDRPAVWRAARRLGLLDRVTAIAEMEGRREPILQTDMLALPEPTGVCRTLPLAAMADGVSVLARPDPYHADWLSDRTARLVGDASRAATPEEWERAIVECVENAAQTASLRGAARELMREERSVPAYVAGVRSHYDEVLSRTRRPVTA